MPKKSSSVPGYCLHKPTGKAYVRIGGRMHYLGRYGSPESKAAYSRIILQAATSPASAPLSAAPCDQFTVVELCSAYIDFAERYYQRGGNPTVTVGKVRVSVRPLLELYGPLPAADFGPKKLATVREAMVQAGWSRTTINSRVELLKRLFRWAGEQELVPATVWHALQTLRGLAIGRTTAPEPTPVEPVDDAIVEATLPHLPTVVADMIRLQRATGMRPDEVCQLRPGDVDRSEAVWRYTPQQHKTAYRGRKRVVHIGPKGQEVLTPYLLRAADAYCFSPREAVKEWLDARQSTRKTPMSCGNRPGAHKARKPRRPPGDRYTTPSYRRAITRGIEKANTEAAKAAGGDGSYTTIPHWSPNRLRHSLATEVRKVFGLEGAQVVLGHARADVTEVYAERDSRLAAEAMGRMG